MDGAVLQALRRGAKILRNPLSGPCSSNTRLNILASPLIAYRVGIHSSCPHNELVALTNRHLVATAHDCDGRYVRDMARLVLPKISLPGVGKTSIWTLANHYTGPKRRIYLQAAAKVEAEGFNPRWANISMFVKPDKYPLDALEEKAPRAIQYRTPMYNLLLGSYLHKIEKSLYDWPDTGPSKTPFMAKGKNNQQRATILMEKIASFEDPLFVCLDHSKFDSSISVDLLKIEHNWYNTFYRSKFLRQLLKLQLKNKGYSKNGIKYFVHGTRMSGDFNTGLGNSLINYICLKSWVVSSGVKAEIFLDGDDSIVIVEADQYSKLDLGHFARFGFTTKVAVTRDLPTVEFCQTRLLPSGPVMARNPFRALSHLAVSLKRYPAKTWPRIMEARGICEELGSAGVPILQAYGRALRTGTRPLFLDDDRDKYALAKTTVPMDITDQLRHEYYEAWGLDAYTQELIEASFSDPWLISVSKCASNSEYADATLRAAHAAWRSLPPSSSNGWTHGIRAGLEILE
nr:MAG: RNA-dependent RNA polymerase [Riboviria sp.]